MARARSLCCLVAGVLLIALIAGCGGGGGGSTLLGGVGRITGSVSELPLDQSTRVPGSPITVTVDGTDISTLAGSDGSFILDRVPIGMHTLVAHTSARACAVVVDVARDQETTVGEMVLSESGQISGLIIDATSHEPIAGASVVVTEMVYDSTGQMPHPVRMRRTDAAGSYTISALPAGEYLVTISKDGYATTSLDLTVNAGSTTTGDASLTKDASVQAGALSGVVYLQTDSTDPRPVPGVLVRLVPSGKPTDTNPLPGGAIGADGDPVDLYPDDGIAPPPPPPGKGDGAPAPPVWFDQYYTYTDENGAYKLDGVPAGQYTAVAVRPGLQPSQQAVTITANETTALNFTMTLVHINYGTIEGTVTDDGTKAAIQGAVVRAIVYSTMPPVAAQSRQNEGNGGGVILPDAAHCVMETRTDANGHYMLKVPTSVQAVIFGAEGYERKQVDVQVQVGGAVTVDAALARSAGGTEYTLQGKVMIKPSATGEAVRAGGATVTAWPTGPQPMADTRSAVRSVIPFRTATADENGNYSLGLPAGEYYIAAAKDDRQSEVVTMQMNENKTRNLLIPFVDDGGQGPPPPPPF
jgi:hypothetical protein